jgi:PAS domain S-box-containing protein
MTGTRPPAGRGGTASARLAPSLIGIALSTIALWVALRIDGPHSLSVLVMALPVVWAGARFGVAGGALVGLAAGILSGPLLSARSPQTVSQMTVRGVLFVALGVMVALLVQRSRTAERRTRESQEHLDVLVRGVQDYAILMLDAGGMVVSWNEGARRIKGYSEEEIVNQHFSRFYTEEDRRTGLPQWMLDTAVAEGHVDREGWRVRKDGSRFWATVTITPLRDADGTLRGYVKITRDDTERRAADERLRELSAERQRLLASLITAAEEERRRIASDIHDDPVQKISALGVRLDMLARAHPGLADDPGFHKAAEAARVSISSLRRLMFDVHPYSLDQDGIESALSALVQREQDEHRDVRFVFTARLAVPVAGSAAHALYRIAQEALSNVDRHARATTVQVCLESRDESVEMSIGDDGAGFEPGPAGSPHGHLGLTAMRERTELAGGEWSIDSVPGQGTTVRARLPLGRPDVSPATFRAAS